MITKAFEWIEYRLDVGGWVRKSYLAIAIVMTAQFIFWGQRFAMESPRSGADIAMILAALGVPLSALTGFAFNSYLESRRLPPGEMLSRTTTTLDIKT